MRRIIRMLLRTLAAFLLLFPLSCAQAETRALLVACSDFISHADLGSAISGNLHMIGSALISADVRPGSLSIEDGTIGTIEALGAAIDDAFAQANETDLSILYLCTHGILSSSDDGQTYLLLGNGETETPMNAAQLCALIQEIQGEKLLIVDACYSGALIGRGTAERGLLPGSRPSAPSNPSPFLADSSIHVLTSASGSESSWYYDSEHLSTGAVSYFASALASGLGLYGHVEADLNGDGSVSLSELHRHLCMAVPSSSSQLLSSRADMLSLPVASSAALKRPLIAFSYGNSLLTAEKPTLDFSYTVTKADTDVQYRLVEYVNGSWDWKNAITFLDENEDGSAVSAGRKMRSLTLDLSDDESGYLMLQVFSVSGEEIILCSERLIGVQPQTEDGSLRISSPDSLSHPGHHELPIDLHHSVPAEITVSVYDAEGILIRRLASAQLTRPSDENIQHLYWDGRDAGGIPVSPGTYTLAAEARIGARRQKATKEISVIP